MKMRAPFIDPETPIQAEEGDGQRAFTTITVESRKPRARQQTHEPSERVPGRAACNAERGSDVAIARCGESTCARAACRNLRLRRRLTAPLE